MSESKMQKRATESILVNGAQLIDAQRDTRAERPFDVEVAREVQAFGKGARRRESSWLKLARRSVLSLRGGVVLTVLASNAFAQQAGTATDEPAAPTDAPPSDVA